ncbi:MAG: MFS transporter [Pseudomonadota bacterium]
MLQDLKFYGNPRFLVLGILGFSSGVPLFLTSRTLALWLNETGVGYTTIGLFGAVSFPYALKFLWAPCIDGLSWPWLTKKLGRRRSWLLVSQVLLIIGIAGFAVFDINQNLFCAAVLALGVAVVAATQETAFLAYQMALLSKKQYGPGEAMSILGYRMGMLASGAGALYIATYLGWKWAYLLMAMCVAAGLVTVLLIDEPKNFSQSLNKPLRQKIQLWIHRRLGFSASLSHRVSGIGAAIASPILDFIQQPNWWLALALFFFFKLGDNLIGSLSGPFYLEIGFSKVEIAHAVKMFGMWATIFGGMIGGVLVMRLGFLRSLYICGSLHAIAMGMNLVMVEVGYNLPVLYLAIALENITSGMRMNALLAYQLTVCNVSYAATQVSLMTSCISLGRTVCSLPSGWLVDHMGWFNFFSLTCAANILPLTIVVYLMWQNGENVFKRQRAIFRT